MEIIKSRWKYNEQHKKQSYNRVYIANYTVMSHHGVICNVNPTINPPVLGNTEGGELFYDFHTTPLRYINDIVQHLPF